MRKEYSDISLNLRAILQKEEEIDKSNIPDLEMLIKESELFGEVLLSNTKPALRDLFEETNRYTGLDTVDYEDIFDNPEGFDELAMEVVVEFSKYDVDESRRALRKGIATYIKVLQSLFLGFEPRLRLHALYIDYLKEEITALRDTVKKTCDKLNQNNEIETKALKEEIEKLNKRIKKRNEKIKELKEEFKKTKGK